MPFGAITTDILILYKTVCPPGATLPYIICIVSVKSYSHGHTYVKGCRIIIIIISIDVFKRTYLKNNDFKFQSKN